MPGAPMSLPEREEIGAALIVDRKISWAELGRRIGRHPVTVAREVAAGGGRWLYRPAMAQLRSEAARGRSRPRRLACPGVLRDRVTAELIDGRSPSAISLDLAAEDGDTLAVETIYSAVYAGTLEVKATDCLRLRRPRRRSRQGRHTSRRPASSNIAKRPGEVNDRSEPGHWEGDHFIGKGNRSAMLCLTERVTRFSILVTMPEGYDSFAALAGLTEAFEQIPAHLRKSITFDQGSEWAQWPTLAATYGIDVWFCDPHSPWQRGQVENLNRQWRWWFPRGTELANIAPAAANHATNIINSQRRRKLDNCSPAALYAALTVQ